jgi:acetyl-CoA synthetase
VTESTAFFNARDFLRDHRSDYERACREFRWPILQSFNWAGDFFDKLTHPSRLALWLADESGAEEKLSYRQLSYRSNSIANFLVSQGVKPGDRLLLMLANESALWVSILACIKIGAVIVPASTLLSREQLEARVARADIRYVIAGHRYVELFANLVASVGGIVVGAAHPGWVQFEAGYEASTEFAASCTHISDPMILYFTSGTTSEPKLILHGHGYPVGHLSTMYWLGLSEHDVHLNVASPGWAKHSWSSIFAPWNAGATVFSLNAARFNAELLLQWIERAGVTSICAPPTVWRMLIQCDLRRFKVSIRSAVSAGEPLNPEVIEQIWLGWQVDLRDGFGQTETTCLIANSPEQPVKTGSMGRPMPGFTIAIVDDEGRSVPAGTDGELALVRQPETPGLMLTDSDRADQAGAADVLALHRTGDVAICDTDGYITFVGRADDVFKSSDYRISPFELESVLLEHPAVVEAAVIPSPDELRMSVPKAVVVLKALYAPSAEIASSIIGFCRQRLAPYQRIRRIEFAELPKTISGKIRRKELRDHESARERSGRRPNEFFEEDLRSNPTCDTTKF